MLVNMSMCVHTCICVYENMHVYKCISMFMCVNYTSRKKNKLGLPQGNRRVVLAESLSLNLLICEVGIRMPAPSSWGASCTMSTL